MKTTTNTNVTIAICWLLAICPLVISCNGERITDAELVKNSRIETRSTDKGKSIFFIDPETGERTPKMEIDWTQNSPNDSLSVFCSKDKRGYYRSWDGKIIVPAKYHRAWVFSEGRGAVELDGKIGFLNYNGDLAIDFLFYYYGNPLSDFVFHNGVCVVANKEGKCGVIDTLGNWLVKPEYDYVSAFKDYAVVTSEGMRKQVTYDGNVLNSFVLDDIKELTYRREDFDKNNEDVLVTHYTGLYAYRVGGRWGLLDSPLNRLTEPLYASISAIGDNIFRAQLLDEFSEVILNARGEVMK